MLFNKDGKGSEELYELSGIFQAGTDYRSIAAEIDSATERLRDMVGSGVVTAAEEAYAENVQSAGQLELMNAVRLPVAYMAIAMHARLSGVSHGDTGRKIKVDDNEKIPFEWMLDRDDRELRERYFRAVDALLRYLDKSDNEDWKISSTGSLLSKSLISGLTEFEGVYPIEHSFYMFFRLLPVLIEEQDVNLKKIVGAGNLAKLLAGDQSVVELRSPAVRYVVLRSLITAAQRWSLDIFPLAIARRFSPSYQGNRESRAATTEEIEWYTSKLGLQAQDAALEMQRIISGDPYEDMSLIPDNNPRNKYFTV